MLWSAFGAGESRRGQFHLAPDRAQTVQEQAGGDLTAHGCGIGKPHPSGTPVGAVLVTRVAAGYPGRGQGARGRGLQQVRPPSGV